MGHTDVDQLRAGTITSSPGFKWFFRYGFAKVLNAKLAEEPEFTYKASLF